MKKSKLVELYKSLTNMEKLDSYYSIRVPPPKILVDVIKTHKVIFVCGGQRPLNKKNAFALDINEIPLKIRNEYRAAGILPYCIHEGKTYILLICEDRSHKSKTKSKDNSAVWM